MTQIEYERTLGKCFQDQANFIFHGFPADNKDMVVKIALNRAM